MAVSKLLIKGGKYAFKHGIRLSKNRQARQLMIRRGLQAGQRGTKVVETAAKKGRKVASWTDHTTLTREQWLSGAQKHYDKMFGKTKNPMEGFIRWKDEAGDIKKATTGKRIPGSDKRKIGPVDVESRKANAARRSVTEGQWEEDLKKALDELNLSDRFEHYSKLIKKGNKVQETRRTNLNKIRIQRGQPDDQMLTIEHIGALKNKWPNIPENRWGLITKRANSRAGARLDPPDLNIRYQGTPRDMREWVLKQEIGSADVTKNLPIPIKRKILAATKKVKGKKVPDTDKINDILEAYYKSIE